MEILDGKLVATALRQKIADQVHSVTHKLGRPPHLAVLIVGEDKASQVYVKNKHLACEKVGMKSTVHTLPGDCQQEELENYVKKLVNDVGVDALLVQLPLPRHLDSEKILQLIPASKDADGLSYASMGYFFGGRPIVKPCTPHGVMKILEFYKINLNGEKAVVVGRSNIVGKPMAMLLLEANATVTICHSKTQDLRSFTKDADIVVVAAGKPQFLGREDFKKGSVVVDVGIHGSGSGTGICGDVRFAELEGWVRAATPVPGGVGPMTITMLLENTCILAEKRMGK